MTTAEFKQSLKALSFKELEAKVEYYKSFEPRGVNYQTQLNAYEAEIERRFLAWEACEV